MYHFCNKSSFSFYISCFVQIKLKPGDRSWFSITEIRSSIYGTKNRSSISLFTLLWSVILSSRLLNSVNSNGFRIHCKTRWNISTEKFARKWSPYTARRETDWAMYSLFTGRREHKEGGNIVASHVLAKPSCKLRAFQLVVALSSTVPR